MSWPSVSRNAFYTLYRCTPTEEKLDVLYSDGPNDVFHSPVSMFLKSKIDKLYLYQEGDIATIAKDPLGTGSALARPPVVCFFQPLPLLPSATNSAHIEVLVCLMTNQSSAEYFELMKKDMHKYVVSTYDAWRKENGTAEALAAQLSEWYPKPVAYISRLIQLWNSPDTLAAFLHLVLTSSRLYVHAAEPLASELVRLMVQHWSLASFASLSHLPSLIERVSVSHLVQARGEQALVTVVASIAEASGALVTVSEPPATPTLSATTSNAFCKTWATRLLSTSDPLLLCGIIQHTKDLLVQELNSTKRSLSAARMDHYELFRLFQRLKAHDNADVILLMLQSDTGDRDSTEVLAVLARCLGFAQPPLIVL